jgi:hypothetical protein
VIVSGLQVWAVLLTDGLDAIAVIGMAMDSSHLWNEKLKSNFGRGSGTKWTEFTPSACGTR